MDTGDIEVAGQQVVCLNDEILALVAFNGVSRDLEVAGCVGGELLAHELYLKGIGEVDGVEHRLKVVIAVRPLGDDVESEIDFGTGEVNHN